MSSSSSSNTGASYISLSVKERTEETVELLLGAFREDFCVRGVAFFSVTEIENFLSALRKYPLLENSEPQLSGGYFDDSGSIVISEHFHISVLQFNATGLLVMNVRAFTPHPEYWKNGFGYGGRCSYFLNYEDLRKFVDEFERLIGEESSFFEFRNFNNI